MAILQYLLQVSLCWVLFYSIYYVFLRKVTFFRVNRWYLLSTLLLGLALPLIRHLALNIGQDIKAIPLVAFLSDVPDQLQYIMPEEVPWWEMPLTMTLWSIYILGATAGLIRLARSLMKIRRLYTDGERVDLGSYTLVRTGSYHLPFSFFSSVYISSEVDLSSEYAEVLDHELEHVRSRHSIDVMVMEIVSIAFWFHPFVYLYKAAIRQTHEYLADAAAINQKSKKNYSTMLLQQSMSGLEIALAHQFFHSHIKKRIDMMYQKQSGPSAWLKYSLALPVLFVLTFAFAKQIDTSPDPDSPQMALAGTTNDTDTPQEVFKVVEEMPRFPGCEDLSGDERTDCSQKKLLEYLYSNVKYPAGARKSGVQGRVFAQFVVEKDGSLSDVKIVRGIGGGCNEAVLDVVGSMNDMDQKWIPGRQRGQKVRVQYTLPVVFMLEGEGNDKGIDVPPPPPGLEKTNMEEIMVTGFGKAREHPVAKKKTSINGANETIDEVFKVVDQMPRFPGCDDAGDQKAKDECASKKLLEYLYTNVEYPLDARDKGVQGRVYVQFIVNEDGSISDSKLLRDIGAGCGKAALKVVNSMNDMDKPWTPGVQRGKKVKVYYTLPVIFKIEDEPVPCGDVSKGKVVTPIKENGVYKVVERMPTFPGCDDVQDIKEHKACADQLLLKYLYANTTYPKAAKDAGIEGRVYIQFIVNEDGSISDSKLLRDIGGGCGDEALRVVNSMNKMEKRWSPGVHNGKKVKVYFTLPVIFKLEGQEQLKEKAKTDKLLANAPVIEKAVLTTDGALSYEIEMPKAVSAKVTITDIAGRTVNTHQQNLHKGKNKINADVSGSELSLGIYVLTVNYEDQRVAKKIQVQ